MKIRGGNRSLQIALGLLVLGAASGLAAIQQPPVKAVPLSQVRLLPGPFKERQDVHRGLILSYDADRLLHNFRITAGLPSSANPYGGWEAPKCGLRGHFVGHYLSACALMYGATGDKAFKERSDLLVSELAKCQEALGSGYLSAFPASVFDVLETKFFRGFWAPYYTIHKIMAGLIDAYEQTGNAQALDVAKRMADYFDGRVVKLSPEAIEKMTRTDYKRGPSNEYGGFAVSLLDLYRITGEQRYLDLGHKFMRDWFVDPLAAHQDRLAGLHANTHIPQVTSFALAAALTGDARLGAAAEYFWHQVTEKHSFAYGGNSFGEHFKDPGIEAADLTEQAGETCNTHNMLRLTRSLFEQKQEPAYGDYFERALYNHILASVAPDSGMTAYFLSVRPGHFKVYCTHDDSMWCCTGTGIENTVRYGEGIYFAGQGALWVNLYIPSSVGLPDKGFQMTQKTEFPAADKIVFTTACKAPVELSVHYRMPGWLAGPAEVKVCGEPLPADQVPGPGRYLTIKRIWREGDTVEVRLPMAVWSRPSMDDPKCVSFFYGPVLLAGGLGKVGMPPSDSAKSAGEFHKLQSPPVPLLASLLPASLQPIEGKPLHFTAKVAGEGEPIRFLPYYDIHHERYSFYWRAE